MNKLNNIIDQLVRYSGCLFEIEFDNNIPMPGLSIIMKDFRNHNRNKIILNENIIKNVSEDILAHILAHEWGHHMLKHVYIDSNTLNLEEKNLIELEADFYAYNFIHYYNYDKSKIIRYIEDNFYNQKKIYDNNYILFKERIDILNNIIK